MIFLSFRLQQSANSLNVCCVDKSEASALFYKLKSLSEDVFKSTNTSGLDGARVLGSIGVSAWDGTHQNKDLFF